MEAEKKSSQALENQIEKLVMTLDSIDLKFGEFLKAINRMMDLEEASYKEATTSDERSMIGS
jgi:hypothetical protein